MLVTLSGIVMLVSLEHPQKASSPILVTVLPSNVAGITNLPDAPSLQPVIVTASPLISYFKLGLTGAPSVGLGKATGSTVAFSPQPPRSRGSDTNKTNRRKGFMGYYLDKKAIKSGIHQIKRAIKNRARAFLIIMPCLPPLRISCLLLVQEHNRNFANTLQKAG